MTDGGPLARGLDGRRIVDLSVALADDLPCSWPGQMPFQAKAFERPGMRYRTRFLVMDEHTGTPADAPVHFVDEPHRDVEGLELGHMMGPACVIDVTRWVGEAATAAAPTYRPRRLRTGKTATDLCSPATSSSCTQAGTSAFARSPRAATPTRPTRSCTSGVPAGLARDVVFVELLCRLGELPPRGATFLFLPIKLRGGTGGPGRAIAFLPA